MLAHPAASRQCAGFFHPGRVGCRAICVRLIQWIRGRGRGDPVDQANAKRGLGYQATVFATWIPSWAHAVSPPPWMLALGGEQKVFTLDAINASRYYPHVDQVLQVRGHGSPLPHAPRPAFRAPPGNRLESLAGDRKGQWSIRVNDRYRICFLWMDGNAQEVEIVDYH